MRMMGKVFATLLSVAVSVVATHGQSKDAAAEARPIVDGLAKLFAGIEETVMATAETAPESLYGFKPASNVRSFGQILAHIADAQKALCQGTHGTNVNLTDAIEKSATTKMAIIEALRDTFAGCKKSIATLTDKDAARMVPFGREPSSIATIVAFTISHSNEHYGNLVTYMRLNGIVPPSSRTTR